MHLFLAGLGLHPKGAKRSRYSGELAKANQKQKKEE